MNSKIVLNNLQKRNNSLKSRLIHEQLKSGNYSFQHFRKHSLIILNEYKKHPSFFKVSSVVGIPQKELLNWYIQGQMGNPMFRGFYLAIEEINNGREEKIIIKNDVDVQSEETGGIDEGEYLISRYGDGWSYKTYVDGEKIFIISAELDTLKGKVKDRHLPIDE